MARTVDILPFATNVGANIEGQSSYVIEPIRLTGHQSGVAKSAVVNKTLRQTSVVVAALANVLSEALDIDIVDDGDVQGLKEIMQSVLLGGRSSIATTDLTFYVRTTGSNANDGLTTTTAWATPQHAWDAIYGGYNLNGKTATINIGTGTFGPLNITDALLGGPLTIQGVDKTSTIISGVSSSTTAIFVQGGARVYIEKLGLSSAGTGFNQGNNLFVWAGSQCTIADIAFGVTAGAGGGGSHVICGSGANVNLGYPDINNIYTISAGAGSAFNSLYGGLIGIANAVMTLTGTPAFSTAFCAAGANSTIAFFSYSGHTACSFSGSATGHRFSVDGTSTISTGTGSLTFLPGDSAGTWVNGNAQLNYT